ncbi:hypothetical protein H8356DRAFT_1434345 [Neocallimastix lanati (nom. inval.)]|nr:hypothetical protein H8356DRAFT_1434345 [Neocallimastix sp. JGI-2020a]
MAWCSSSHNINIKNLNKLKNVTVTIYIKKKFYHWELITYISFIETLQTLFSMYDDKRKKLQKEKKRNIKKFKLFSKNSGSYTTYIVSLENYLTNPIPVSKIEWSDNISLDLMGSV